jgi:hypothetical protein
VKVEEGRQEDLIQLNLKMKDDVMSQGKQLQRWEKASDKFNPRVSEMSMALPFILIQ